MDRNPSDAPPPKSSSSQAEQSLPYAHLNLRYNPFGELPQDVRAHLAVVDVEPLLKQLVQPNGAVQLIGEMGRGKTTHLLAIKQQLANSAYVYIDEGTHSAIPKGNPLLIDEADRLSWLERRAAFRRGVPLAIGTHTDMTRHLKRYGYQVLSIEVGRVCDAQLILSCAEKRISFARRYPGSVPRLTIATASRLVQRFGSDIRTIEDHLYDVFQDLQEIRDV
jgi:hypothetical protein